MSNFKCHHLYKQLPIQMMILHAGACLYHTCYYWHELIFGSFMKWVPFSFLMTHVLTLLPSKRSPPHAPPQCIQKSDYGKLALMD